MYNNQYIDQDLGYRSTVIAEYVKTGIPEYDNNPFITALPIPELTMDEIMENYQKDINLGTEDMESIAEIQRRFQLDTLLQLRFPLPYHQRLEFCFIESLRQSYSVRSFCNINLNGKRYIGLKADPCDGPSTGFTLLGCSGSGKSTSVKSLLSHYPQVIIHKNIENIEHFTQIVYLVVTCYPNSNFEGLYISIGEAIDTALGTNCYEDMVRRAKGLTGKLRQIQKMIEIFAIGMIILDEIQLINFEGTKENTFESFMVLSNQTKVAISIVGTSDAYTKVFSKFRTARRTGSPIIADMYCSNHTFFRYILSELYKYQFFNTRQELTESVEKAFYDETHGLVYLMIMLYIRITDDYLQSSKKYKITEAVVKKTAAKHFKTLQDTLKSGNEINDLHSVLSSIDEAYRSDVSALKQKKAIDDIVEFSKARDKEIMIDKAESLIRVMFSNLNFNTTEFHRICSLIIDTQNVENDQQLAGLAYKQLTATAATRPKPKKTKAENINFTIE